MSEVNSAEDQGRSPMSCDPEKGSSSSIMPNETDSEDLIVYWSQPEDEDAEKPLNWSIRRKYGIIGILSFLSLLVPLASSMLALGVPLVLEEFNVHNDQLATFVVSVFVLGFALGPLVIAPLSELCGRNWVYHVCNALFTVFTIGCALAKNIGMLIAMRFLAGFAGVAVLTNGSGTIVDMMPADQRGRAMALWSGGPILGPVVGPACAGFLVEAAGWRWVFWLIAIADRTVGNNHPSVSVYSQGDICPDYSRKKAARLRKETGNPGYQSKLKGSDSSKQLFAKAIIRPLKMLVRLPLVTILCTYVAAVYGIMYILFSTFAFVFEEKYGFSAQGAGLVFIGGGIGNVIGQVLVGFLSDKLMKAKREKGEQPQPELRLSLYITVPAGLTLPLGLIMYGWTAQYELHWIAPVIGTPIMGFGLMGIFMGILNYLVDVYQGHAASVTAANAVLRSLLGALLPLIGLQLNNKLGLGWGNTLLGLIMLALSPVTWALALYGERIRKLPAFAKEV